MKELVKLNMALLLVFISSVWSGVALHYLWNWFVVTTFNLAPIGVIEAVGVVIVAAFLTHQKQLDSKGGEHKHPLLNSYTYALVRPALFILLGWLWMQAL